MKVNIVKLDWDSDFFDFNVCRVDGEISSIHDLNTVSSMMDQGLIKLAYYSSINELKVNHAESSLEIKLLDKKTTFVKKTSKDLQSHPAISFYDNDKPSARLVNLAIQSGKFSRFNVDEKISNDKYEEMYEIWITKSVSKEIAEEVLIYRHDDKIAGYLTVGKKNNRADLGMGAVDSKYRGLGIGRVLFENAEKWAYDCGYQDIQIVTQGANIPACTLYEKIGYAVESKKYFYHFWKKDEQ